MIWKMRSIQLMFAFALIAAFNLPAHAAFPGKNGRIAFIQGPDVYTMKSDGSDVKQLTAFTDDNPAFWENWSPDAKQLVFSRFPAPDFFGQLWLMNADGSNQHLLLDDPGYDDEAASFSPDGGHIIFSRCAPLDGEFPCAIYRINSDGSGLTQVTPVRIELADFEPVYAPDGRTIAFDSFERDGIIAAIHLMNSDGSDIRRISEPAALPNENFVMNLNGSGLRRLAPLDEFHHDLAATYSPDGKRISFESDRFSNDITEFTYGTFDILTMDADGRNIVDVVSGAGFCPDDGNCVTPSWGPSEQP